MSTGRPASLAWTDDEAPQALSPSCGVDADGPALIGLPPGLKRPALAMLPEMGPEAAPLRELLDAVLTALRAHRAGHPPAVFDLSALSAQHLDLLDQALGEGDVSAVVAGGHLYQIQESTLTGLWRIKTCAVDGPALADHLEIADIPSVIRAAAEQGTSAEPPAMVDPITPELMNLPSLLSEIAARMVNHPIDAPNHIISFTLLPMSDADMDGLRAALGDGPVSLLSRGYGSCRVTATGKRRVWSVQHLNAMGAVILDTLEIGDIPVVARAADEDFADSAERLGEILEAYF